LLEALQVAQGVMQNRYMTKQLTEVTQQVAQGLPLSSCLTQAKVFTPLMINMIAVGEETGQLEETLFKVAEIYEKDILTETKRWMSLVEPALIIFLALGIGFMVIAMLLPIFQMNLQIR
jgi:type II secretory pathway component PulF